MVPVKLICPVCGKPLQKTGRQAVCEDRHSFDYAKSGYLNLYLKKAAVSGDDAGMVKARTAFLETGAYSFLREKLCENIPEDAVLADLGCGEGYYTSAFPAEEKYGFDLSKTALAHAAKNDPATQYVLASIFRLPLASGSCDCAVTCFAPAAADEITRILKPGGIFLFVVPDADHLIELKQVLYERPYLNPEKTLKTDLAHLRTERIRSTFTADRDGIKALYGMTPYAWKTSAEAAARLEMLDELSVTAAFRIHVYQNSF